MNEDLEFEKSDFDYAGQKHARINLNTGESYEPPLPKEHLKIQIEGLEDAAADLLRGLRHGSDRACNEAIYCSLMRLLQIVKNQQAQIEEMRKRLGDPRAPVTLGDVDAIIERAKAQLREGI